MSCADSNSEARPKPMPRLAEGSNEPPAATPSPPVKVLDHILEFR
jgi:hypothetical protein